MSRKLVLFQASFSSKRRRDIYTDDDRQLAREIASHLGRSLIENGLSVVLNGRVELDADLGTSAVKACNEQGIDPRERIRTYPYGEGLKDKAGFGMVMQPVEKRWQDVRTFIVNECDAVIGLAGGKGTADVIQKCVLAGKPVFPIAVIEGNAKDEWERLRQERQFNRELGDLDFLADVSLGPAALADKVARQCSQLLTGPTRNYSNRVFIVHGHDASLKSELARFLDKLGLVPVILHEQADAGRFIFQKLQDELADVGYGFILLTPDDSGASVKHISQSRHRARQNVVFEHGMLIGMLGHQRVCAIVRGDIELPSDLHGIVYKHLSTNASLSSIALDIVKELKRAMFDIDANKVIGD